MKFVGHALTFTLRNRIPGRVPKRRPRAEVYRDRADAWRWRLRANNGQIIADGSEGYATASNARRALRQILVSLGAIHPIDLHVEDAR